MSVLLTGMSPPMQSGATEEHVSDILLMSQVQTQSKFALEQLYERYAARALGLAFKLIQDHDMAEDVVQESFWRVWERAEQFDVQRGTFINWLFGIVRHLALDEIRRQRRVQLPDEANMEQALVREYSLNENMAERVLEKISVERVYAAVRQLPVPQREVIELSYFYGLTRQQIAQHLGEPLGTVHTRAALGLQKLREMVNHE